MAEPDPAQRARPAEIDTAAIRAEHERGDYDDGSCCDVCGMTWPCDAVQVADALDAARAREQRVRKLAAYFTKNNALREDTR